MNITHTNNSFLDSIIYADTRAGTTYYSATLDELLGLLEDSDSTSALIIQALEMFGFDILDLKTMYGSQIIGDVLYICETNGVDINVAGKEVDPERALEQYDTSMLSAYIKPMNETVAKTHVTVDELKFDENTLTDVSKALLDNGFDIYKLVGVLYESDLI